MLLHIKKKVVGGSALIRNLADYRLYWKNKNIKILKNSFEILNKNYFFILGVEA